MKKILNSATFSIGIVCLIMAFLVTLQIKSVIYNHATSSEESKQVELLVKQLNDLRLKNEQLTEMNSTLRFDIQSFKEEAANNSDSAKTILSQLERAEILAGMTKVEGSGVIVTVKDSSKSNLEGDLNNYVIHDGDLLTIVNELRDAGAEALSINNERILATSEIRCAGSTVSVNNNRYSFPFTIKAIGDPVNLENALKMRGGVYETLTLWGLEIEINKASDIEIPAYDGMLNFKYAKQVKEESGDE